MAEKITLTVAETKPNNTGYKVERLTLDWPAKVIYIQLLGDNGEAVAHAYTDETAAAFMVALNKANLSTQSLQRRILQRLITDGVISGSVTGTVD